MLFWNNISFWWLEAELAVCRLKCTELVICVLETKLFFCELKNARLLTCRLKAELIICELKDARLLTCKLKIILKISRFWACHISWNLIKEKNCFFSKITVRILTKNEMQYSKQNWKIRVKMLLLKLDMTSCFLSHEWLKMMRYCFKSVT